LKPEAQANVNRLSICIKPSDDLRLRFRLQLVDDPVIDAPAPL